MKLAITLGLLLCFAVPARAAVNEEQAVTLLEQFASIADKNKGNCDAMGDALSKFVDDNAATLKELGERAKKRTDAEKQAFRQKYGARLQAAVEKIRGGMMACHANPKVKAAMDKMKAARGD